MNYQTKQKELNRICNFYMGLIIFIGITLIHIIGYLNVFWNEDYISPVSLTFEPIPMEVETVSVEMEEVVSDPCIYEMKIIEIPTYRMEIDNETYNVLLRVVEAEVTGDSITKDGKKLTYDEMLQSKIRVAQVFMNRVEDNDSFKFIDSLYESLTYKNASSTFNDGRYYSVEITDITREAVDLALLASTKDYTEGALYFSSGTTKNKYGDYIFTDDVGHSFFK